MHNQDKEGREQEAKLTEDTLNLDEKDIVKEIFYHPPHHGPLMALNRTLAYSSALLFKLSQKAEESTKLTIKLTKRLLYLTWAIAILTAVILLVSFVEFPKKSIFGNQKTNQTEQYSNQNQSNKTNENHKQNPSKYQGTQGDRE